MSFKDLALSQTAPGHWLTWGRLTDAVRGDGKPVSTTATSSTRSRVLTLLARAIPGVGRVQAQAAPFAQAWQSANTAALRSDGPLWVALGDSMSQGIGARDITGGWVGQLHTTMRLHPTMPSMRLVNLSTTGATIADVLDDQIPRMHALGVAPDLVTVLIGANDMVRRSRRPAAVTTFARLLTALPDDVTVIATLPRRTTHAQQINTLIDTAARTHHIRVADLRPTITLRTMWGTRAEDHFHPNERGYAAIAATFATALTLSRGHRVLTRARAPLTQGRR